MALRREVDKMPPEKAPSRRPWHAPQFYRADVSRTEGGKAGGGGDGMSNKS
jgi:hypothetical protein